jgi:hypothetical protein
MCLHYTSLSLTHWPAYPEDNFHTNTGNIQLISALFEALTLEKYAGGYAKVPEWLERAGLFKGTKTNVISFEVIIFMDLRVP